MESREALRFTFLRGASRLVMALTTAGCAGAALVAPAPAHAEVLAALGASDVVGVGAAHPDVEGWVPVLASLLPQGTRVIKVGGSGWQAQQVRDLGLPEVLRAHPDTVVLWVGVNDFLAEKSLPRFRREFSAILARLEATKARVVVLNLPDLDRLPAMRPEASRVRQALPQWQRAVEEEGRRHGALVIDLTGFSAEIDSHPDYLSPDGFHLSAHGYRRLAEIIFVTLVSSRYTDPGT